MKFGIILTLDYCSSFLNSTCQLNINHSVGSGYYLS